MIRSTLVVLAIVICGTKTTVAIDDLQFQIPDDDPNHNSDVVTSVAFSPDGQAFAAAYGRFIGLLQESRPGQVILWDTRNGTRRLALREYVDGVSSVAFSPDGNCIAASGYVGDIKLWRTQDGELIREIAAPGIVSTVAFSPDGCCLAAGLWMHEEKEESGEARIWKVATGEESAHFVGHTGAVLAIAFSPDGKLFATGSMDGSVRTWDPRTGVLRATVVCPEVVRVAKREAESAMRKRGQTHEYEPMPLVDSVVFSPDGRRIAAAFGEQVVPGSRNGVGVVQLWDVTKNQPVASLRHRGNFVGQVCYSPNGSLIATAGRDGSVILWDSATLKEMSTVSGDAPIAFAPDGQRLVVGSHGASLRLIDIPDCTKERAGTIPNAGEGVSRDSEN